jgi:hypothetical protein
MMTIVLIVAALLQPFGGLRLAAPEKPQVLDLDQSSRYVVVTHVAPGTAVDVYAGGYWLGRGFSRFGTARVPLRWALRPGTTVSATLAGLGAAGMRTLRPATVQADATTYHFDNLRTGWNPYETTLTTSNVSPSTFGPLFTLPIDGNAYAQPLIVNGLLMPDGLLHNVLYICTENDTIYAFDADTGALLWQRSLVDSMSGITAVTKVQVNYQNQNVWPTVGVTGTPVIDRSANALFVVAATLQTGSMGKVFQHVLHSIALDTGLDNAGSPVVIGGGVTMSDSSFKPFVSQWELQRAGLLLVNGVVYVPFASHGDASLMLSNGFIFAYDENTLAQLAVFSPTTDAAYPTMSTIWGSGYAPAADAQGNVYAAIGNALPNATPSNGDYGNSVIKLGPSLSVEDYFTPYTVSMLNASDLDLGSAGTMLLPDQPGAITHLAVACGKAGWLYLMNRDALGGYTAGGPDRIVQEIVHGVGFKSVGVHGGPAYYLSPKGPMVYYIGNQDKLRMFKLLTGTNTHLTLFAKSPNIFTGLGGSVPVISSNGSAPGSGIVWALVRPDDDKTTPVMLTAFDASYVYTELYSAPVSMWQNPKGGAYLVPTVMNGKVYVPGANSVTVFGLIGEQHTRRF